MTSPLARATLSESEQAEWVYTLSDYFAQRPTLESVAPCLVRDMLEDQYPLQGERLVHAALIEPESCGNEVEYRVLTLAHLLIERFLGEWAPLLLEAYKQALVDFWNSPLAGDVAPWQRLSEFFAAQLRLACTVLSGDELATVEAVLDYPDLRARQARFGSDCAQAYIPIIDTRVKDPDPLHVQALAISRWVGERQI